MLGIGLPVLGLCPLLWLLLWLLLDEELLELELELDDCELLELDEEEGIDGELLELELLDWQANRLPLSSARAISLVSGFIGKRFNSLEFIPLFLLSSAGFLPILEY